MVRNGGCSPCRGELMTDEAVRLFSRDYKLAALRRMLAGEKM